MVYRKSLQKRKLFSNLMLFGFLLLVGATALLSNALKTPIKSNNEYIEQAKVFNNKELENITHISLKNKSGEYIFERADTVPTSPWHMTSPRDLSANSIFIEKLFSSLNIIKTKKLLPDDPANNSNFSLDKPTATLSLNDGHTEPIVLSIGIMNTIDNSTYLKISGRQGIYHVEAPSISLENVTLHDLFEATIFDFDLKSISSFTITKKNVLQFSVELKDGFWLSADNKPLDPARLEDLLNDFSVIKSSHTIDKQSETQEKQIQGLFSSPEYIVKIKKGDKVLTYQISKTITSLHEIALNDSPHFLIRDQDSSIVYVVKEDFLVNFELKNDGLKSLEVQSAPTLPPGAISR